jgi:hypothetical protein
LPHAVTGGPGKKGIASGSTDLLEIITTLQAQLDATNKRLEETDAKLAETDAAWKLRNEETEMQLKTTMSAVLGVSIQTLIPIIVFSNVFL